MRMTADTAPLAWTNDHAGRGANLGATHDVRETT
jgi:hypothetical protein